MAAILDPRNHLTPRMPMLSRNQQREGGEYRPILGNDQRSTVGYAYEAPQQQTPNPRVAQSIVAPSMRGGSIPGGGASTSTQIPGTTGGRAAPGTEDWNAKLQSIQSLIGQFSPGSPRVSRVSGPGAEQEKASRDAAFARAKETAGMSALGSMKALDDVVAQSGLTGSTMAAAKQGQIIGGAGADINEFLRDQAIEEAGRATNVANLEYQGQVSQRNAEQARQQAIMSLLMGALY